MSFKTEKETSTELNLSLFSLPNKPKEPPEALTPPLRTTAASIPFQWEEEPGKPRQCNTESKPQSARTLELPPRLLSESKHGQNNNLASPTTVLDGPEMGRSLFVTYSFRSPESLGRRVSRAGYFGGSSRWGSFRKNKEVVEADFDISPFSSNFGACDGEAAKVRITSFRRRNSFLSLSQIKSPLLVSIYESFKQVVPWKRRQDKLRKK